MLFDVIFFALRYGIRALKQALTASPESWIGAFIVVKYILIIHAEMMLASDGLLFQCNLSSVSLYHVCSIS